WIVDLERGTDRCSSLRSAMYSPGGPEDTIRWAFPRVATAPILWVHGPNPYESENGDARPRDAWIDARTNRRSPLDPEVGTSRDVARASAPLRDTQDRRVWVLDGAIEREIESGSAEFETVHDVTEDASHALSPHFLWDGVEIHLWYGREGRAVLVRP